jgi:hypothetical protein
MIAEGDESEPQVFYLEFAIAKAYEPAANILYLVFSLFYVWRLARGKVLKKKNIPESTSVKGKVVIIPVMPTALSQPFQPEGEAQKRSID